MQNIFQNKKIRIISIIIIVVLALGFSFFFFYKQSPEAEAGWWNEDWRYRKKLTIDQTKIDADLTDFPVAVVLTTSNFTYTNAQSEGQDIRFTDTNGTPLSHEIEKWNTSATSTIWVKVPSVDSEVDTTIYMYYGNGSVADGQKIAEVWDDDFASVYHLNETPYCPGFSNQSFHYDSSKYLGSLRCIYFTGNSTTTADGILDGADFFDSANFSRLEGDNQFQLSGMPQFTLEAWVRNDVRPTGSAQEIIRKTHSVSPWSSYNFYLNTDGKLYFNFLNQNGVGNYYDGTNVLATSTWYHVVALYDGTYQRVYINGVLDGQDTTSGGSVYKSDSSVLVGSGGYWDGIIDEVRVQTTARSEAWIKASYESGRNNLITFAAEEKGPGPVAYWGFEEGGGTNITDLSGNGHTLIASSTVWKTESECKFGKCIYFDGATSVATTTNTDELNISGSEITLTGWFKPLTQSGKKMLLNKGSYAQHWNYGFGLNNTGLLMRHNNGDKTTTNVTINTNDWHYFTAVYSGGNDYFYIDGVLVESMSDSGWSESTGTYQLTLGAAFQSGVGYSEFFHGFLDEVKVYNYARSADQIRNDYNKNFSIALGGNEYTSLSDGLVSWWKMDEASWNGTAGEVKDSSGSGNHGTANNALATSTAKFNRAGNFDGDTDTITLSTAGTNLVNISTSSLTMSIWLKTNTVVKSFADISNADSSTYFMHLVNNGSIVRAYFYLNGTEQKVLESDSGSISVGQWYHMAVTRDYQTGDTILYLNGVEVDRLKAIGTTGYAPTSIGLGNGSEYCFDGQLDDFRIYNRALSPDEVRRLSEWAPEPVSYWKFDEATGQNVYSSTASSTENPGGQGYLGTSVSEEAADPLWTLGKYGSALKFDATNAEQVYIPDPGTNSLYDFTTNDSISFALWVKPSVYGDNDGFINKGSANNENWGIEWEGTGSYNRLQFYFRRDDETGWSLYRTDQTIPLNEWSHIAVSYTFGSSTSIKMYVDGVLTTGSWIEGTGAETPDNDDTGIYIGRNPWGGEEFTGSIDDVRLYRYIRNSRQVLEDMNAGKKNNPIGYWSFDEGQGGTAYDNGYLATLGSGNNGTLTNMTTSGPSSVWLPSGKAGKALQFDGTDDEVVINNSNNLTPYDQSRSVSLWFMAKELGVQQGLITTGDVAMEDSPLWLIALMNNNVISVYQSGYKDGKTVIERNKWYHLVYTYDVSNNSLKLYLNGQLEYIGTFSPLNSDSANIFIGGGWSSYFQGSIDEVKIYNYPITVDEIRQNYNVGQQIVLSRSANDNLTDGLLAYWPMDGDLTDASGNGNTGSATGATATSSAKFGKAYAIGGGSNYISVNTSASLDSYTDKLTVSGWYYFNTLTPSQQWLFDKAGNYYLRVTDTGAFTNYLFGIDNADYWTTGSGLVTAGRWYYIVFSYDGQERKLYIDGQLKASKTDTGNIDNGGNLTIGNRSSHIEPMSGQVDDIKIYNRVLLADEIAQNYADGPKPVAYWKMDDLLGTTAVDSSGNGNTGSLTNGPVWKERGKVGGAIQFDGSDDWISLASSTALADIGATSFSFWVNPQSYTNKAYPTIYNRNGQSETDGYNWLYFDSSGDGSIWYSYANGVSYTELNLETLAPLNTWSHIVLIHDRKSKSITSYKNGVFMETETYADTVLPVVNGAAYIGTYGNSSTDYPFQGQLDDFKIYNFALTPRQIAKEYNSGGPVGYWKMDEGEGVNVKDYSGSGNHGTLVVGSGGIQSVTSSAWTNGLTGKINSSLNFDGIDDRVNLGSVTTGENVTISAWIKTSTSSPEVPIFSNRGSGVYFGIASGKFFIYDNSASPSPGMTSNASVNDNNWHNLIWTSNGSSSIMYIDGEFDSRQAQSRGADTGTAYIAWDASNAVEWFPGQIDEVKIWNYPLTPNEVKNEFNGGFSSFFR